MDRRRFLATAGTLPWAVPLLRPGLSEAATGYPNRAITYVAPYPAGTTTDFVARAVAQALAAEVGQPVVVDNRGGAGGTIGSGLVAHAKPDGYTLLQGSTSTHGINPTLYSKLPYDAEKSFEPIGLIASSPLILIVNPQLPARTAQELIALARARPGTLRYGSAGNGSSQHLGGQLFESKANVDLMHVPYKGGSAAMTDLLGGQIDMMFEIFPTALPHMQSGRLRALGVTSLKRMPQLPELATLAESGVPGYEMATWHGMLAPAGTPRDIVVALNQSLARALATPALQARFAAAGLQAAPASPEDFGRFIHAEVRRWSGIVKASGARIE
ncbi:tripartite tricarboxylate transporter substrate binding protein [Cupriavidus sp. WS]|uniref:Bug family tripartite tricarboxylate transporter substrate binding protein n=1 Tax=Cupriavidus sp. WS TaxID=1312922 RepID=UPI00036152F9|nr:tripartite tricarboxylate transporter substrate binding protein [Cupriavidus sp. WS]